jgi:adenylate cyclase
MRRRRLILLGVVALVAAGLGVLTQATGALHALELDAIDARFKVRDDDSVPKDVVVLGMNADTFHRFGPRVPRRAHARAIRALKAADARTIAYDIEFIGRTHDGDIPLVYAIRAARNVVLGTTTVEDGRSPVLGSAKTRDFARTTFGFAGFPGDRTATIRRVRPTSEGAPTFAAKAAGRSLPTTWIDYRGDPTVIPFLDAVDRKLPDLDGKIVVVGDVDPTGQDIHGTPLGIRAGPEIQAAAIDTLLRGGPLNDQRDFPGYLLIVLLGVIVPLSAMVLTNLRWLPVAALEVVAWPVAAQLAFDGGTIVPFVPGALAGVIGMLGTLAVTYATELRVRRRMREQFARFVPASIVDEVVDRAGDDARLPGVRCTGTVLFADLRGFTTCAETMEAEQVIEMLNHYLGEMSDAILDHGGTVVSYMGDGIMAVFGAPIEQDDHADRALAASREMIGPRLDAFNAATGNEFKIGIGLASGSVMSGTVGGGRRVEYSTVGDTTNTAARLESMTRDTGHCLHVHEATRAALNTPPADLVEAGEFEIRGKQQRVRVWTLRSQPPSPSH